MKKCIILLFLAFGFQASAQPRTTKGTEFWFTYMENLALTFNGPPDYMVVISSENGTSGQLEVPHTGLTIPFTVAPMSDVEISLPAGVLYPQGDEATITFGFKVVANDSVNVYAYHSRVYFTEASMILPISELTSEYMVAAQKDYNGNSPSEFVIEATQDSTVIEITPSQITASFRPANVPFTISLNKGNVYQLQSYENLTGTRIRSLNPAKKLAVFGGARQAHVYCSGADDHLYDQNYMNMFGTEFVTVPMAGQGGDVFNIVSLQDSNNVYINFGQAITLMKGEFLDTLLYNASYIVSNKPIAIAQYNKSQQCNSSNLGDPNMVIIPPVTLKKQHALFRNIDADPINASAFTTFYVNIVVPTSGTGAVFLDNQQVTGFQPLASNGAYSWKQLPVTAGSHHLYAASGMNAFTYGFGSFNSYAYHLGYDADNSPTGLNDVPPSGNGFSVTVSPNPVSSSAVISINGVLPNPESTLRIYNTAGQLAAEKRFSGNQVLIDEKELASGLYYYTITSKETYIGSGKFGVK